MPPLLGVAYFWHFPLLIVLVSLVYSATRYDDWASIGKEALRWGLRLTAFLVGALVVMLLIRYYA